MKATIISIPVKDQSVALTFYTDKLGFIKKRDIPLGGGNRWLTIVSAEWEDGPEILLEPAPNHFEPTKEYQQALFKSGIPWTQFDVEDVEAECQRMVQLGIEFTMTPTEMGTVKVAIFDDTCGNLIQLVQML